MQRKTGLDHFASRCSARFLPFGKSQASRSPSACGLGFALRFALNGSVFGVFFHAMETCFGKAEAGEKGLEGGR